MILDGYKKVYMIGIGGIGMSRLAYILKDTGFLVSGSDVKNSKTIEDLENNNIKIYLNQKEENLKDLKPDVIIVSSAIKNENSELLYAKKINIPIFHRVDVLSSISNDYFLVAIAGTHGKTTTTALTSWMLSSMGFGVLPYVGGVFKKSSLKPNRLLQEESKKYMVLETDESDVSFLKFNPQLAIITNIDKDHLVSYDGKFENLISAFEEFITKVSLKQYGIVTYGEDKNLNAITKNIDIPVLTYGTTPDFDLYISDIVHKGMRSEAKVYYKNKFLDTLKLKVGGIKNLLNGLSSVGVAIKLELNISKSFEALELFKGIKRRLEVIGEYKKVLMIDDHADHPTEIMVTLNNLKAFYPEKRLVVVLQPHRFTRVKDLIVDYGKSLLIADHVFMTDIYSAGESEIENINGEILAQNILKDLKEEKFSYIPDRSKLLENLVKFVQKGDLLIFLGPGNINEMIPDVIEALKT